MPNGDHDYEVDPRPRWEQVKDREDHLQERIVALQNRVKRLGGQVEQLEREKTRLIARLTAS
jgi:predicted RNase H-like nuclease (RuvC/YqgF family)